MLCQKLHCLKQVNPNIPNLYFGMPFEKDENWHACYLCEMGLTEKHQAKIAILPNRLIKRIVSIDENTKQAITQVLPKKKILINKYDNGYLELFKILAHTEKEGDEDN